MLAIRAAKSQNELVTKALGWNRAWVMTPTIRNSDQTIDILLELRIGHQGQVEAILRAPSLPKNTGPPRSEIGESSSFLFVSILNFGETTRAVTLRYARFRCPGVPAGLVFVFTMRSLS